MVENLFGDSIAECVLVKKEYLSERRMIHVELSSEGERLRDEGIRRSADHAEAVLPNWGDMAFRAALRYIGRMKGNTFTSDQLRAWAERYNFPTPPDKRAWGSVFRRLSAKGHITSAGFVPSTDPKSHCCPSTLWRAM